MSQEGTHRHVAPSSSHCWMDTSPISWWGGRKVDARRVTALSLLRNGEMRGREDLSRRNRAYAGLVGRTRPLWSSASLHCNVGLILVFQPKRSLPSSSSDLHFRQERESGMQVRTDLRVPPLVIRKSRSNRALAATPTLRLTSSDSGLGPAAAGLVRLLLLPKIWIASRTTFPMPASQILNRMSGAAVFAAAVAEPVLKEASFACMLHVQGVPLVRPLPPSIQSRHHRPIQKIGVTHRKLTSTT